MEGQRFKTEHVLSMNHPQFLTKDIVDRALVTRNFDAIYASMKEYRETHSDATWDFDDLEECLWKTLDFREKRRQMNILIRNYYRGHLSGLSDETVTLATRLGRGHKVYHSHPMIVDVFQRNDRDFFVREYVPTVTNDMIDADIGRLLRVAKGTKWYHTQNDGVYTFERQHLEENRTLEEITDIVARGKILGDVTDTTEYIRSWMHWVGFTDVSVEPRDHNMYAIVGTHKGNRYITIA